MGPAVIVVTDGASDLAEREAQRISDAIWDRKEALTARLPSPPEAVAQAAQHPDQPITLLDVGDNVGGGSPGDSTFLLHEILRQNVQDCLVLMYDPDAVEQCVKTGVRAPIDLAVGGKTDSRHGTPVPVSGVVKMIADGKYVETQPRHGGKRFGDMGTTAVVETPQGHLIVLHSLREAPMSLQQILNLGIQPESRKIMVAKGAVAPRAAYDPVSAETIPVDTPGVTAASPQNFTYQNRPKPLYPLDQTE
jgi:microcystin degradation protein MlrC